MKPDVIILAAALALLVLLYFILARGPVRKVTFVNASGSEVSVSAEVADNPFTRTKGLMGRSSLGEDEGMLFVFDKPGIHSFWMLNTTIQLDAIHISENGTVVDVIQMEPCGLNVMNCPSYKPAKPAKYVLEVNKGFAKRHNLAIGKSRMKSAE